MAVDTDEDVDEDDSEPDDPPPVPVSSAPRGTNRHNADTSSMLY